MTNDNKKALFTIIATMFSTIVSYGLNSKPAKIAFALIFFIICFLDLSNFLSNKLKFKKIVIFTLSVIEILLFVFSIFNIGSPSSYLAHMKNFFVASHEASSENIISSNVDFESYFQTLSGQIEEINKKIENNNSNIENIDNELNIITNGWNNTFFNENRSDKEIDEIVQLIEEKCDEHSDSFADLRNDPYSIELLYKAFISEKNYYYCNILEAFDTYGIKTDKLDITENTLFIWDIERLYMTYNMKNSIANELESEEIIEEKTFNYNDYKVNLNRFSDTFDYGNWYRYFTDSTSKEIDTMLNSSIMNFYKKFVINFSTE